MSRCAKRNPSSVATGAKYAVVIAFTISRALDAGTTAEMSTEFEYTVMPSRPPASEICFPSGSPTSGFDAATDCAARRATEEIGVLPNPTDGARYHSSIAATGAPSSVARSRCRPRRAAKRSRRFRVREVARRGACGPGRADGGGQNEEGPERTRPGAGVRSSWYSSSGASPLCRFRRDSRRKAFRLFRPRLGLERGRRGLGQLRRQVFGLAAVRQVVDDRDDFVRVDGFVLE